MPTKSKGSVSRLIQRTYEGDSAALQALWERYYRRLVLLARRKVPENHRRASDEEDVVQSALDSFFRGIRQGRFPLLSDRDSLWHLLILITVRKAADQVVRERRLKRGGGKVAGESVFLSRSGRGKTVDGIGQIVAKEPSPEFAAIIWEEFRNRLATLQDDELRLVAQLKLEGYENAEVADRLGCSLRSVERKLRLIRDAWR